MKPLLEIGKLYNFYYKYHQITLGPVLCIDRTIDLLNHWNNTYKVWYLDCNKIEYASEGLLNSREWRIVELFELQ